MLDNIKNVTNILFYAVISIVTVLSYLQARKTLFAPIRTETFKLQLKAFEEILSFFQNKTESDFLQSFDFDRIVSLNTLEMADGYVSNFFSDKIKLDKEAREKTMSPLIGAVISKEHAEKYFQSVDANAPIYKNKEDENKIDNAAIILAKWQSYEHAMVGYTQQWQDQMNELNRLSASPILPKQLRDLLGSFESVGHDNLTLISEVITDCSKRMPEHFPSASNMKDFSPSWIWNEFNSKRKNFEPTAKSILDFMNNYLKIEQLMQK